MKRAAPGKESSGGGGGGGTLHEPGAPFQPGPCWAVGREGQEREMPGKETLCIQGSI